MEKTNHFAAIITLIATVGLPELAPADTLPLSKINRQTEVLIQRGNTGQNVECYWYILKDLQKRGKRKSDIYVTFDDPETDGLGVGIGDTDENYTCEEGQLRVWEEGKFTVLKSFK